jgi:hypothetical protein
VVRNTWDYWVSGLFAASGILKDSAFPKLDLFPFSGKGGGDLSGPLERTNLSHWLLLTDPAECLPRPHLRTETNPVFQNVREYN